MSFISISARYEIISLFYNWHEINIIRKPVCTTDSLNGKEVNAVKVI